LSRKPFLPGQGTKPGTFFLFVNHDSIARGRLRVGEEAEEPELLACRGAGTMGDAARTDVELTKEMEKKETKLAGTVYLDPQIPPTLLSTDEIPSPPDSGLG